MRLRGLRHPGIDGLGGASSFSDGPHDQTLTATGVACGEKSVAVGLETGGGDVAAVIEFDFGILQDAGMFRVDKSNG